jgi:hypothetical protein
MRVIAKMDDDKVLCEVTVEELANLNGFRSVWDDGFDRTRMTQVGAECNLKKMIGTSRFVRTLRPDVLKRVRIQMESLTQQLDETMETVAGLDLFNVLSEDKPID